MKKLLLLAACFPMATQAQKLELKLGGGWNGVGIEGKTQPWQHGAFSEYNTSVFKVQAAWNITQHLQAGVELNRAGRIIERSNALASKPASPGSWEPEVAGVPNALTTTFAQPLYSGLLFANYRVATGRKGTLHMGVAGGYSLGYGTEGYTDHLPYVVRNTDTFTYASRYSMGNTTGATLGGQVGYAHCITQHWSLQTELGVRYTMMMQSNGGAFHALMLPLTVGVGYGW